MAKRNARLRARRQNCRRSTMSSLCDPPQEGVQHRVLIAFGLTTLAGLATTLGALVPIFVKHTKPKYLASALSFAAGVMLYVSFAEIMDKSEEYLACTTPHSAVASVGCFFCGVVGTMGLHLFVHRLEEFPLKRFAKTLLRKKSYTTYGTEVIDEQEEDPLKRAEEAQPRTSNNREHIIKRTASSTINEIQVRKDNESGKNEDDLVVQGLLDGEDDIRRDTVTNTGNAGQDSEQNQSEDDKARLKKMGLMTALAIGLHNFPEGMAAFVATLSATSLGVAVTCAVAIHNIPEGVCVSMPLYYATGSKTKAFFWAFVSGISEPIGALVCYLVFRDGFNSVVYGVLFGMIAGMMVFITLKELLPTAHKYDTSDTIVTPFIFVGMAVMGGSLLLFDYTE